MSQRQQANATESKRPWKFAAALESMVNIVPSGSISAQEALNFISDTPSLPPIGTGTTGNINLESRITKPRSPSPSPRLVPRSPPPAPRAPRAPVRRVVEASTPNLRINYGVSSVVPSTPRASSPCPPCPCTKCCDWMNLDDKWPIIFALDKEGHDWMDIDLWHLWMVVEELDSLYHQD